MKTTAARTRIKFCGMTREDDVRAAVALGADAVGFVCYAGSPRYVAPDRLAALAAVVPAFVTPVLLFVNASEREVRSAFKAVPHALLQFHGDESPAFCRGFDRRYLRALSVDRSETWVQAEATYADAAALLADAPAAGFGGSGMTFDWSQLPTVERRRIPLILAGGLRAENVGAAITATRPYAVDVSSGIEDSPGQKSSAKMREFAVAVRAADLSVVI